MGRVIMSGKVPNMVAPKLSTSGLVASDLAVGSSVYLNENGSPIEYLVVNQGIPSESDLYDSTCDGVWLLRKDIYENREWNSTRSNDYESSTVHAYLNGTFLGLFDDDMQSAIKQVLLPHCDNNGTVSSGASGMSAKVFLLSACEVGYTTDVSDDLTVDSAKLDYFISQSLDANSQANYLRIAYLDYTATAWWLRSPMYDYSGSVFCIDTDGDTVDGNSDVYATETHGVRPALILPSTALFDAETRLFKGVA